MMGMIDGDRLARLAAHAAATKGLYCECGHAYSAHSDQPRGPCVHCPCDRVSGLHRTLVIRPDDPA